MAAAALSSTNPRTDHLTLTPPPPKTKTLTLNPLTTTPSHPTKPPSMTHWTDLTVPRTLPFTALIFYKYPSSHHKLGARFPQKRTRNPTPAFLSADLTHKQTPDSFEPETPEPRQFSDPPAILATKRPETSAIHPRKYPERLDSGHFRNKNQTLAVLT